MNIGVRTTTLAWHVEDRPGFDLFLHGLLDWWMLKVKAIGDGTTYRYECSSRE